MSRIVIVPGLAVRGYATTAAEALRTAGHDVTLLDAPGWPPRPPELDRYGSGVAEELRRSAESVDLLIGLSVGTQAAAVVAAGTAGVSQLLLISPTVDPEGRTPLRLLGRWLRGEDHPDSPTMRTQLPDWRRAGPTRILRTFLSVRRVQLEQVLPQVSAAVTIAHADHDQISSHDYAVQLARLCNGTFLVLPGAPHSWPVGDADGLVALVGALLLP